jgi:hypothetical protein
MIEPLRKAVEEDNGARVAEILRKCPKAVHAELDILREQPLRFALSKEKYAAAQAFLDACPALRDEGDSFGRTALLDCADRDAGDDAKTRRIMQWLIERAADIHDRDSYAKTALHYAALRPTTDIAAYLIDKGAEVDARDRYGGTPLMAAASRGDIAMMALLLEKGARLNAMNVDGVNAVTEAVLSARFDAAAWLMQRGAEINFALPKTGDMASIATAGKQTAFLDKYTRQRDAWNGDRSAAETEDAVRSIEGGVAKSVTVTHALKLKTGLGKFRKV